MNANTLNRKNAAVIVAVLGYCWAIALPAVAELDEWMENLEILEAGLDAGGIEELLAVASREDLDAPNIPSQYLCERIARQNRERGEFERAKRAFGAKVAEALDAEANRSGTAGNARILERQADRLLDMTEWMRTEMGYGNYLLAVRCENLSAIPIGYLAADLNYPEEKIAEMQNRIMTSDEEREFRRTVLNSEAPEPFIGKLNGTDSEQNEQMQMAWNRKWKEVRQFFAQQGIPSTKWKRSDLPEDLQYFLDEQPAGPQTTTGSWELNRHETVVNGYRDRLLQHVRSLVLYRQLVGNFPTEPPAWWNPKDPSFTALEAAFEDKWKPFRTAHGPQYSSAARVYQQVEAETLSDRESKLRRIEVEKARSDGAP